jgi:hypothetical protein
MSSLWRLMKVNRKRVRRAFPDDAVNRVDQRLHLLLRQAERGILALNAAEHLVEGLRELAQFVAPAAHDRAHRVVLFLTDNFRGPGQLEHRPVIVRPSRPESNNASKMDASVTPATIFS